MALILYRTKTVRGAGGPPKRDVSGSAAKASPAEFHAPRRMGHEYDIMTNELPRTNVASRNRIDPSEDRPGGSHRAARPHHRGGSDGTPRSAHDPSGLYTDVTGARPQTRLAGLLGAGDWAPLGTNVDLRPQTLVTLKARNL